MKKNYFKRFIIFLGLITALLGASQVFLSGIICSKEKELDYLEKRKEVLRSQNRNLEQSVVAESSLQKIKKQAIALGFKESFSLVDYSSESSVALRQ